jgi:hypothetical protein
MGAAHLEHVALPRTQTPFTSRDPHETPAGTAQAFENLERYATRPATPAIRNVAPNQGGTWAAVSAADTVAGRGVACGAAHRAGYAQRFQRGEPAWRIVREYA